MQTGSWMKRWALVAGVCAVSSVGAQEPAKSPCAQGPTLTVADKSVGWNAGKTAFFYQGGLAIDADGAPNAYHPQDTGLDHLANAGKPGNWWALVTEDGKASGQPVVQGSDAPFPGYYISTTALEDTSKPAKSPARYVDSGKVPYLVLPPQLLSSKTEGGARLGDFAAVMNTRGGKVVYALVADRGPKDKLGEGSIALAEALGIASSPKKGGTASGVAYVVFPGSGNGKPRPVSEINTEGARLLNAFGGASRLTSCLPTK